MVADVQIMQGSERSVYGERSDSARVEITPDHNYLFSDLGKK